MPTVTEGGQVPKEKTTLKTIAFRVTPEEWAFIDELNRHVGCTTSETLRDMLADFMYREKVANES